MPFQYCQGGGPINAVCRACRMAGFYLVTSIFISAEWTATNSDFLTLHNQFLLTVIRMKYVHWGKTEVNDEEMASLVSIPPSSYHHFTAWSVCVQNVFRRIWKLLLWGENFAIGSTYENVVLHGWKRRKIICYTKQIWYLHKFKF